MPNIVPIRDLRNTNEISELVHRIDQAIYEAEKEYAATEESLDVDDVFNKLNEKYYGCK